MLVRFVRVRGDFMSSGPPVRMVTAECRLGSSAIRPDVPVDGLHRFVSQDGEGWKVEEGRGGRAAGRES
jgi:hypothetical protein